MKNQVENAENAKRCRCGADCCPREHCEHEVVDKPFLVPGHWLRLLRNRLLAAVEASGTSDQAAGHSARDRGGFPENRNDGPVPSADASASQAATAKLDDLLVVMTNEMLNMSVAPRTD
jgi:hypothetical protein